MPDNRPVLISDLGKVLIDYDPDIIIKKFLPHTFWDRYDMYKFFATSDFFADYEKGLFPEDEFFRRLRKVLGLRQSLSDDSLKEVWNSMFFPIEEMLGFVRFAEKEGSVRLFLLSNISETHYEFLYANYRELDLFEHRILSYKVGSRKPEKRIFEYAKSLAPDASSFIFTDDREEFIYSARECGIDAFVFQGFEDFMENLKKRPDFASLAETFLSHKQAVI